MSRDYLYKAESYRVIEACFVVHKEKGSGCLEPVYQVCLAMEMEDPSIPYAEQDCLKANYNGRKLQQGYLPDYLCVDKIIVEIKAVKRLNDEHRAQIINYLKATGIKLGLLVSFGNCPRLK